MWWQVALTVSLSVFCKEVLPLEPNYCSSEEDYFEYVPKTIILRQRKDKKDNKGLLSYFNPINLFRKDQFENVTRTVMVAEKRRRVVVQCCLGYIQDHGDCVPRDSQDQKITNNLPVSTPGNPESSVPPKPETASPTTSNPGNPESSLPPMPETTSTTTTTPPPPETAASNTTSTSETIATGEMAQDRKPSLESSPADPKVTTPQEVVSPAATDVVTTKFASLTSTLMTTIATSESNINTVAKETITSFAEVSTEPALESVTSQKEEITIEKIETSAAPMTYTSISKVNNPEDTTISIVANETPISINTNQQATNTPQVEILKSPIATDSQLPITTSPNNLENVSSNDNGAAETESKREVASTINYMSNNDLETDSPDTSLTKAPVPNSRRSLWLVWISWILNIMKEFIKFFL